MSNIYAADALKGQTVLIVGGQTGIGRGVAEGAAQAGARVMTASRRAREGAGSSASGVADHIVLDLADEGSIAKAFDGIPALDHVLITASPDMGSWGTPDDHTVDGPRSFIGTKLMGSWAVAHYARKRLNKGGTITFFTGGLAVRAKAGFAPATVAFSAVETLASSLAVDYAPIRVNTIRPGLTETDMWSFLPADVRQGMFEAAKSKFPARRVGTPNDIANAALFLMTSPYVTGATIEVTGGETLIDSV